MLKALIKKQFLEMFRYYFVDKKTGKASTRSKTILRFVGFSALMLYLCGIFAVLSVSLGSQLIGTGLNWLYFAFMGFLSILLGVFGSVFNTYAGMYLAKDNELLVSMPIPSSTLLLSRLTGVAGLSLMYSAVVWVPAIIVYQAIGGFSPIALIYGILLTAVITLFVTVLTCFLGWIVALIAGKMKNKSILTAVIVLVLLGGYYVLCFRLGAFFNDFMFYAESIGNSVRTWANLLYQLGRGAAGSHAGMWIFTAVTAALSALCFWILSRTFLRIVTKAPSDKKVAFKGNTARQTGARSALLRKELKRFLASPTYMLNAGLGCVFCLIIAVVILIKREVLLTLLSIIPLSESLVTGITAVGAAVIVCLLGGMNSISTPSVSLEGKSFWLTRSLPVATADILTAKRDLHVYVTAIPCLISAVILGLALRLPVSALLPMLLLVFFYVRICADFGLLISIRRANFTWTTEMMPIKQDVGCLLSMLFSWLLALIIGAGYYFLRNLLEADTYLIYAMAIFAVATRLLEKLLLTRGAARYEAL